MMVSQWLIDWEIADWKIAKLKNVNRKIRLVPMNFGRRFRIASVSSAFAIVVCFLVKIVVAINTKGLGNWLSGSLNGKGIYGSG